MIESINSVIKVLAEEVTKWQSRALSSIYPIIYMDGIYINVLENKTVIKKVVFHQEKDAIVSASLSATNYVHLDDTGGRVNGQNNYVHVLCSPYFTGYFTREHKDRLTILEILGQGIVRHTFTKGSYDLMLEMGVSNKVLKQLQSLTNQELSTEELRLVLQNTFGVDGHATAKKIITEASAIIEYQQMPQAIQILVCDDAPQFKQITEIHQLLYSN